MERQQRKGPVTGPVILELRYSVESQQSPAAHSLTKHYLDLLMAPVAGVNVGRSRILLRDDSQVQFLICSYDARMGEDTLRLRVGRLSDFFEDLQLYRDVRKGAAGYRVDDDRDDDDDAFDDWRKFYANQDWFVQRYGAQAYNSMELLYRRDAQEQILSQRDLQLSVIADLFALRYHRYRNDSRFRSILSASSRMVRNVYNHPLVSADFGHRPLKDGDTKLFKQRVRTAVQRLKDRLPVLFPMFVPCGVTIQYVPPRIGTKVDLDNLARKAIIPAVHEILQPPATSLQFMTSISHAQKDDPQLSEMIERYKRAPKFHVANYEVICVPRLDKDPENGSVHLAIHSGDPMRTSWSVLRDVLSRWRDNVEA